MTNETLADALPKDIPREAALELLDALILARDHIDMTALEVSHCKDAERIRSAIFKAYNELFNTEGQRP